jgi:hypothetical protein
MFKIVAVLVTAGQSAGTFPAALPPAPTLEACQLELTSEKVKLALAVLQREANRYSGFADAPVEVKGECRPI